MIEGSNRVSQGSAEDGHSLEGLHEQLGGIGSHSVVDTALHAVTYEEAGVSGRYTKDGVFVPFLEPRVEGRHDYGSIN